MNTKLQQYAVCIAALCTIANLNSVQLVKTFNSEVGQKVYDRAIGTLFLSLASNTIIPDVRTIYKAPRPIGNETPTFIEITTTNNIDLLTELTYEGNPAPYLGYIAKLAKTAHAIRLNGKGEGNSGLLKNAAIPPVDTGDVLSIAGMLYNSTQGFLFATVTPTGSSDFGAAGSGVAVVALNDPTPTVDTSVIQLTQTSADGSGTVKALALDVSSAAIKISTDLTSATNPVMYWDNYLQRLYVGLRVHVSAGVAGGKAVVVGRVSSSGTLTWSPIIDTAAIPVASTDTIIAANKTGTTAPGIFISSYNVRIMHCSTGPSYLIDNGTVSTATPDKNLIYALPLVDNPSNETTHGTIADKNSALSNGKFVVAATTTTPTQMTLATDNQAKVGAGPLPIAATTAISDIEVIGDAVYASVASAVSTDNTGIFFSQAQFDKDGKIASWTPWTKRSFPYNAFLPYTNPDTGVAFFAVDAVTGKTWAVDGGTKKTVVITAWDRGATCTTTQICPASSSSCCANTSGCSCSCKPCRCQTNCQQPPSTTTCPNLTAQVAAALPNGCFSVLDLDQSTNGFTHYFANPAPYVTNRFALFGGTGTIVFARTSYSTLAPSVNIEINSPQIVINDFSNPANFLVTKLPDPSACVKVLEYSRQAADQLVQYTFNYFFAATDNGLYVFSNKDGSGFTVDQLNQGLTALADGMWQRISDIPGSITDIKTLGIRPSLLTNVGLYVITTQEGFLSTVYRIPIQPTVRETFATKYILAQSGVGIFQDVILFTGIRPVVTYWVGTFQPSAEQLVLATNYGLFVSTVFDASTPPTGINAATNQAQAAWTRIADGNNTMFYGVSGVYTVFPSTVWPFSVEDACGFCTFQASNIYQLSDTFASRPNFNGFVPRFFNAINNSPAFANLYPITNFWTDGARRIFIINRQEDPACQNKLMSFPYNTNEWRICNPATTVLTFDSLLSITPRFYWVQHIGATGILMAGTSSGVISLE